jgi:hypothetical protein
MPCLGLGPEVVNLFNYHSAKYTYSMVCLFFRASCCGPHPQRYSNCSIINTYSMARLGLKPEVLNFYIVKGHPFLEGVRTLYEMCIIVLLLNLLGWSPVYYNTISIARC